MRNVRRIWRAFLWLVCAGIALGLLGVIGIRVERHVLRHRAEALMVDMQSIRLRQTTFQQAQPIFRRWRKWGTFAGPCSPARCDFQVELRTLNSKPDRYLYLDRGIFYLASLVGESPTAITAHVGVLNGVVANEQIGFAIETPRHLLSGQAASVSQIKPPFAVSQAHADYAIWAPANFPDDVRVEFTAAADPAVIHRLMVIHFSCLTRWLPCQSRSELMPAAIAAVR